MDIEKLRSANIPESWWEKCYITADGMIFTPQFNENGEITKTGEQAYNEWIANKDKVVPPTLDDRVKALEAAQLATLGV